MIVVRAQNDAAVTGTSTHPSTIMSAERIESHRLRGETGSATGCTGAAGGAAVVVAVVVGAAGAAGAGAGADVEAGVGSGAVAGVGVVGTGTVSPFVLIPSSVLGARGLGVTRAV